MFRYKFIVFALSTSLLGCETSGDYDAWLDLQDENMADEQSRTTVRRIDDAVADDFSAVLQEYECTYFCEEPRASQTAVVSQTSQLAAEAEVLANGDSNGDGIADFCPGSTVRSAACKKVS